MRVFSFGMFLTLVLLTAASTISAEAGDVVGTVEIKSTLKMVRQAPKRRRTLPPGAKKYLTSSRTATKKVDQTLNVVVHLISAKGGAGMPGKPEIIQKDLKFSPFVLPVKVGTTVTFPNQDTVFHSVYSESEGAKFQLPEYAKGETRDVTFSEAGVAKLFCGIHPRMAAYVVVLDNGHFTMPNKDHAFQLKGVPPGKYVLKAWHPLLNSVTKIVEVPKSGKVKVDLTL